MIVTVVFQSDRVFQKEVEPIYYWEDREDKVKYSVELTIRDVEKSDSGEYVCSVKRLDNEILQETAVNITVSSKYDQRSLSYLFFSSTIDFTSIKFSPTYQ